MKRIAILWVFLQLHNSLFLSSRSPFAREQARTLDNFIRLKWGQGYPAAFALTRIKQVLPLLINEQNFSFSTRIGERSHCFGTLHFIRNSLMHTNRSVHLLATFGKCAQSKHPVARALVHNVTHVYCVGVLSSSLESDSPHLSWETVSLSFPLSAHSYEWTWCWMKNRWSCRNENSLSQMCPLVKVLRAHTFLGNVRKWMTITPRTK